MGANYKKREYHALIKKKKEDKKVELEKEQINS